MAQTGSTNSSERSEAGVTSFRRQNVALNNVTRWKNRRMQLVGKPLAEAGRLKERGREAEMGREVERSYSEMQLRGYTRIELAFTTICLGAMVLSGAAAFYEYTFVIATILTTWMATIGYRFYKHHSKCLIYLQSLNSQKCPHCGKPLGIHVSAEPSPQKA